MFETYIFASYNIPEKILLTSLRKELQNLLHRLIVLQDLKSLTSGKHFLLLLCQNIKTDLKIKFLLAEAEFQKTFNKNYVLYSLSLLFSQDLRTHFCH